MPATLKVASTLYRSASFEREEGEAGKLKLVVSTDTPYKRWDWDDGEYWEVLDHGVGGVDDERLKSPGLPILFNHDTACNLANARKYENDGHRLILEENGFIWASGELAENKKKDVESGALPHCSVGYEIIDKGVEIGQKDGLPIYRFKWKIYEASVVPVPADVNSQSNRNRDLEKKSEPKEIEILTDEKISQTREKIVDTNLIPSQKRETTKPAMTPEEQKAADEKAAKQRELDEKRETQERGEKVQEGVKAAREREKEIRDIAKRATVPEEKKGEFERALENSVEKAITDEKAVADFQTYVFKNFWGGKIEVINTPSGHGNGDIKGGGSAKGRSIGRQFVESESFQNFSKSRGKRSASIEIDYPILGIRGKVAMAQRAGFTSADLAAVNVDIQSGMVGLGVQRLTIMDVFAPGSTSAAAIIYPRENSFGTVDGVAVAAGAMPRGKAVGERGLKPIWEPDLTTETAAVKKIAVTTKVPDEFMADFPASQSFIDERLPFMVDTETEYQMLYGDGLGNNLKGVMTFANVQTRAITTTDDSTIAASLMKGLTDIRVNAFFEPDFYAFHPYDWETAKLLKDDNKRFLAGGPNYIPYTNNVFLELNTFWGKPVVVSTAVTYRQPIAGCGKLGAQYFIREGMRLESTNSNEDDFRRNLIMLRAEHRLALAVYRPLAFLEFTGFPARA